MTRKRTFSDPAMQRLYDLRRAVPALSSGTGGLGCAYHVGLKYPDRPSRFHHHSLAYAAWAAGVDTALDQPA